MEELHQAQMHLRAAHKALDGFQHEGIRSKLQDLESLINVFPAFQPQVRAIWDRIAAGLGEYVRGEIGKLATHSQKVPEVSALLFVSFQLGLAVEVVGRWGVPQPVPTTGTAPDSTEQRTGNSDV